MKINFNTIKKHLGLEKEKPTTRESKIKIDDELEQDYEIVKIDKIGLIAPLGLEGGLILKSEDGREFPISAFSGDVAKYISNFTEERHDDIPSMYNLVEQICEESEILLVKVKIFENGGALRANLYFTGEKTSYYGILGHQMH